jgi:ribulose-5-phosphate 4-epimerase/fuculose-1-phosphate aldolase
MFEQEKQVIIETGLAMDKYQLIALAGGNVSSRMSTGEILSTPSGMIYDQMSPSDVLVFNIQGDLLEGDRKPSSDLEAILYIFANKPDVNAVIHTHQPYSTAISLLQNEFRADLTTLGNAAGGSVKVAPYSPAGSVAMGEDAIKYLGDSHAVILAHHGVITVGKSLKQALNAAVYMEECAKAYLAAAAVGPTKHLSDQQIQQTVEVYKFVGQDSAKIPDHLKQRIK